MGGQIVKTLNEQIKYYRRILYRLENGKPLSTEQEQELYKLIWRHAYNDVDRMLDEINQLEPEEMSLSALRELKKHIPGYTTMTRKELLDA